MLQSVLCVAAYCRGSFARVFITCAPVRCSMLQCVEACCKYVEGTHLRLPSSSMLPCGAVCCSAFELVAVCRGTLCACAFSIKTARRLVDGRDMTEAFLNQTHATMALPENKVRCGVLRCVAVGCGLLQCVAVRCNMLQRVAICYSVL